MFELDVELFTTGRDPEEASQRRSSGQHSSQLQVVLSRLRGMSLSQTPSETVESAKPSSEEPEVDENHRNHGLDRIF